ncbi:MAG: 2-succinyl-5-enolpyruvyl-6-hydroxy-3-cyclohexene-1-carboxylic-acid synthase [Candidatus Nanopelagicaceae bacterium]
MSEQATNLARHIVRRLVELGISDVVISPGSRNAPLSLAFSDAAKGGLIETHIRIDERGAVFYALGLAKATNRYVPVVSTSGTAVANFMPALLEAYHSNLRLLLLTADRPERVRKTGSNQTTLQQGIFGNFVVKSIDTATAFEPSHLLADSQSNGGPVHFNLQFDEPLLPDASNSTDSWLDGIKVTPLETKTFIPGEIAINQERTVVIIGHDLAGFTAEEVEAFALATKGVVLAEDPLSFPQCIPHASLILSDEKVRADLQADLAIVIGRTTLNRSLNSYISAAKRIMVIDPRAAAIDTRRSADEIHHHLPKVVATKAEQQWRERWLAFFSKAAEAISSSVEWSEGRVAAAVAQIDMDALFVASSRPIRDIEAFALPRDDARIPVFANRGLAGIDGNISTAMGIAHHFNRSVALLGDLAFLHDISALTNLEDSDLTIIVVDNNGGGIFSTLPQRGVEHFESVFGTPHEKDLKKVATSFGVPAVEVDSIEGLLHAYEATGKKRGSSMRVIIAKMPDRESNAKNLDEIRERFSGLASGLMSR